MRTTTEEITVGQPEKLVWEGMLDVQGMRVRVRHLEPEPGTRSRCVLELTALDTHGKALTQALVDVRNRLEAERLLPVATEAFVASVRMRQSTI
jgi:hypothetical protein